MSYKGRDVLTLQEFSPDEILYILKTAKDLKEKQRTNQQHRLLEGKQLALIFQKPSTRTRVSFEVAMNELGGSSLYLSANDLQLGRGETIADTARVLSRYVHCIMARVYKQKDVEDLAAEASVPVINGLSDLSHPMQILADLLTVQEKKGKIKGVKIAFVGDGNNVCNTLLVGCTKLGADISVACPKNYQPNQDYLSWAKKNAEASGSRVTITEDPTQAVEKADVVYTDVFVSMGADAEREQRMKVFLPKYQVTEKLFSGASHDAIFMHDLPAHRNEEVVPGVIDGPRSVVWDQAENRMHTSKAVLSLIT